MLLQQLKDKEHLLMTVRFYLALWTGKIVSILMRLLRKKGTTFPGFIALKICPNMIGFFASRFPEGAVIITGTNGKTTTNNLLASILKTAEKKIAFNREGANMLTGIAGALLQNTTFAGMPQASVLLLEVDEATLPGLCRQLTPRLAVITNFFRDQLDRYGELDTTIKLVKESLPAATELVLNADDPLVAQIGTGRKGVFYFGVSTLPTSSANSTETREGRYCSHCGQELSYTLFHYGQLGYYRCPGCGFRRPNPYIEAKEVKMESREISFRIDDDHDNHVYRVPLQGYYNLYNVLAAFCAADRLQISREDIGTGLNRYVSDAGRMEQFLLLGCEATLTLVKNPTGFNQVIHTIAELPQSVRLLIAINDLAADGRDISWLWDVDFEILALRQDDVQQIICSGLRAEDMALRLKYAGIKEDRITMEHSLEKAVEMLEKPSANAVSAVEAAASIAEAAVFILPTYTALFPIRDIMVRKKTGEKQRKAVNV
jgi:UDP-N-acetylmuramyl tripeptide synthase